MVAIKFSNSTDALRQTRRSTRSLGFAIPYSFASISFSLFGGIINLLVMIVLIKYVRIKQKSYVYMLSLFLSDFLYNVVVQPQVCFYQFPTSTITDFGNNFIHGASLACILIGASSLFLASLDKYIFIKSPYFYDIHVTKSRTRTVTLCVWFVCVAVGVMRFHRIAFVTDGYSIIIATTLFLTVLVQINIFVVARTQDKNIQQLNRSLAHNYPQLEHGQSSPSPPAHHGSSKAAKVIGLMLAVYIASWLPTTLYRFEYRVNGGNAAVYHTWIKVVNLLIQLHSCVNPFIFVVYTTDVKMGVRCMLRNLGVEKVCSCFVSAREESYEVGRSDVNVTGSSRMQNADGATDASSGNTTGSGEESDTCCRSSQIPKIHITRVNRKDADPHGKSHGRSQSVNTGSSKVKRRDEPGNNDAKGLPGTENGGISENDENVRNGHDASGNNLTSGHSVATVTKEAQKRIPNVKECVNM